MNVVDSSGWLEYFANGSNSAFFATPIQDTDHLIVPSLSMFEVFKRVMQQRGHEDALVAIAAMRGGVVVDLSESIALQAAMLSLEHRLALADSIMLATAQARRATLWTQDADFANISGVEYRPK